MTASASASATATEPQPAKVAGCDEKPQTAEQQPAR